MAAPLSARAVPGRDPRRLARRLARRIGLAVEALDRPHLRAAGDRLLDRVLAAGEALAMLEEGHAPAPTGAAARAGLAGSRFLLEVLGGEGAVPSSALREIATGIRVLERAFPGGESSRRREGRAW